MKLGNYDLTTIPIQYGVDATPDGHYAMRILEAYRQGCNARWTDNTAGVESTNPLLVKLNEMQDARAEELDKAIAILKKAARVKESK